MRSRTGPRLSTSEALSASPSGSHLAPTVTARAGSLVAVRGLTRSYGSRVAVSSVSFELGVGVTGLLGPNGAGKSSLLTCLAGIASWDAGSIWIGGQQLRPHSTAARQALGYTPERLAFPNEMRVNQYLRFAAHAKKISRPKRTAAVQEALERAELMHVQERILGNLSKGYRQRVGLAQALLGNPLLAVLDEPSGGLDPLNMMQVRTMLRDYARDRSVLISTHQLADARLLCDRVIVMSAGQVVYDGTPAGMVGGRAQGSRVRIALEGEAGSFPMVPGVTDVQPQHEKGHGRSFTANVASRQALGELVRLLARDYTILSVEPTSDALETAFQEAVDGPGDSSRNVQLTSVDSRCAVGPAQVSRRYTGEVTCHANDSQT